MATSSSFTFRKFNQDALDGYVSWVKNCHGEIITLRDTPQLPPVVHMLAGSADALAANSKGNVWPVYVKKIWQSSFTEPKSVEEIAKSRENFYIEEGPNGKWLVKPDSQVYFATQNILMSLKMKTMDLILYNERNGSLLVVGVQLDPKAFNMHMMALQDYLNAP